MCTAFDLSDCPVDAIEIARAALEGFETVAPERLLRLAAILTGDFLEGLEIERSPAFCGWLTAQRRRFRSCQAGLLEHLDEARVYLASIHETLPRYCVGNFLTVMQFAPEGDSVFREAAERILRE